jgi:hypothetical protein
MPGMTVLPTIPRALVATATGNKGTAPNTRVTVVAAAPADNPAALRIFLPRWLFSHLSRFLALLQFTPDLRNGLHLQLFFKVCAPWILSNAARQPA